MKRSDLMVCHVLVRYVTPYAVVQENLSKWLSQLTPGFSGADIANVCNEAALRAAREKHESVSRVDFEAALERVAVGMKRDPSAAATIGAEERRMFAYHEAAHALVSWALPTTDLIQRESIVPRVGDPMGYILTVPTERHILSTDQLFERMCVALAGRAAETLIFNKITTGSKPALYSI